MAKDGDGKNLEALAQRTLILVSTLAESMSRDAKLAKEASKRAKIASKEAIELLPSALIRRSMEDAMQEHDVKKESAKDDMESDLSSRISVTEGERLEEEREISKKINDATEIATRGAKVTKAIEAEVRKIEEDVKKIAEKIGTSDSALARKSEVYLDIAIEKVAEAAGKIQEVKRASEDAVMAAEDVRNFLEEIKEMSGSNVQQGAHKELASPPIHKLGRGPDKRSSHSI